MNEQLRQRLEELEKDFMLGQSRLRELEMQEASLRETLLRISGAIQVIKELLGDGGEQASPAEGNSSGAATP